MVVAARLQAREVATNELNWTDTEDVAVDNEFEDLLVDRRSLTVSQSSSQEGNYNCHCKLSALSHDQLRYM